MIKKTIRINKQPWITSQRIVAVASSEPVQEYSAASNSWYPDRTVIPLVLDPVVSYRDPVSGKSVENAASILTNGHWYRLDNTSGGTLSTANEITSGTTYVIDTAAGSATYGRITIKENVNPGNNVTYVFRCTLPTPEGNQTKTMYWRARCHAVETLPVLKLDNLAESTYDPLNDTGAWVVNPVLEPTVSGATFTWETFHGNAWGVLDSTHYDWAIKKVGNGISIDRSLMQDQILFRCKATFTLGGKTHTETVTGSVTRRLPKFEYDIADISSIDTDARTISPRALIQLGDRVLTDPKGEMLIQWYNGAGTQIAQGLNPVISVGSLSADMDLGLDVKDAGGWKSLEDNSGNWYIDGDGKILILR